MAISRWVPAADATPGWVAAVLAVAAVILFVLSPLIGSLASVVAVLLALAATPAAFAPGWRGALAAQPAPLLLVGAFAALVVSFLLTAREAADISYALNFAALPAAAGIWLLLRGADSSRLLAWTFNLCLAGAVVAAVVAVASIQVFTTCRVRKGLAAVPISCRVSHCRLASARRGRADRAGQSAFVYYAGPAAAAIATLYSSSRGAIIALVVLVLVLVHSCCRGATCGATSV